MCATAGARPGLPCQRPLPSQTKKSSISWRPMHHASGSRRMSLTGHPLLSGLSRTWFVFRVSMGWFTACGDIPPGPDVFYWLFTREGLDEPSDVLDFFRGCNGYSTGNPCTISDVPVYAFWVKKSVQVGEDLVDFVDLVYFFYYPYNRGKEVINTIFGNHVGDWEHVTVRLMWSIRRSGWMVSTAGSDVHIGARLRRHLRVASDRQDKWYPSCRLLGVGFPWRLAHGWQAQIRRGWSGGFGEDLVDWTSEGTAWDTWNYMEAFDYNLKQARARWQHLAPVDERRLYEPGHSVTPPIQPAGRSFVGAT